MNETDARRDHNATDPSRLIVTGDRGFVGRHFCSRYGGSPLADLTGPVDLTDMQKVRSAITALQPEAVLHLAAQSSVAQSFADPWSTLSANFVGTFHLLQALKEIGFQGVFLYVGSADIYGRVADDRLPVSESEPLRPRSPYAVSKVAAEALCYQWSQTEHFRIVMARPFNQIGPGQDYRFAIADFAKQVATMRRGRAPHVLTTGDLDVTRDFTDVRDTVNAYKLLLELGRNGEIYNICSGEEILLRSLVEELVRIADINVKIEADETRMRPVEQRRMAGDPRKIKTELGWTPRIKMTETLADILADAERD